MVRWQEIRLPEGKVDGFDVNFNGDNRVKIPAPQAPYTGLRIIGAGKGRTHVKASRDTYHDSSVFIGPSDFPVRLESLSIHGARRKAIHAGLNTMAPKVADDGTTTYVKSAPILPNFQVHLLDGEIIADLEADGSRPVWGTFGIQCDWLVVDSDYWWTDGNEHGNYEHGWARLGSKWVRVTVHGSGAENDKARCDTTEIQFVKGAKCEREDVVYKAWNQPWSWRGGAAATRQGTGAALIRWTRCMAWGREGSSFMRTIMVDNAGGNFYSATDGKKGGAFANGHVLIELSGMVGGPGPDWYGPLMRVGPDGSDHAAAQSLTILKCGAYGTRALAQISHVPKVSISECNTPQIRDYLTARGASTDVEAMIAAENVSLRPFSAGYVLPP